MDLKEQIIKEYLEQGCGYRKLQAKYGIGRTTICKWVQIYQVFMDWIEQPNNKATILETWMTPTKGSPKNKSRLMICRKNCCP
ncbi:MAG: helix-turn-helix domain-containing protein [Chitinophagaceae bacterium]|nr:helix-turn-helix domain-containing protein [Chitinophagaceae bacterium]